MLGRQPPVSPGAEVGPHDDAPGFAGEGQPSGDQRDLSVLRQQAERIIEHLRRIKERIRELDGARPAGAAKARVDAEKCTGCGVCVDACPVNALSLAGGVAVADEGSCMGCGVCVRQCPVQAVSLG
jgi:ferredoxin